MTIVTNNTIIPENQLKIISATDEISMTTVEIAEQTGKQKAHVKRDAHKMLLELVGKSSISKFGEGYKDSNGVEQKCGNVIESMTLKDRTWTCPKCGVEHDRDINAAINIAVSKKFVTKREQTQYYKLKNDS